MEHLFTLFVVALMLYAIRAEYKHNKELKLIESRQKEVKELYKFLRKDEVV